MCIHIYMYMYMCILYVYIVYMHIVYYSVYIVYIHAHVDYSEWPKWTQVSTGNPLLDGSRGHQGRGIHRPCRYMVRELHVIHYTYMYRSMHSLPMPYQECWCYCGGDVTDPSPVVWVWANSSHVQDCHGRHSTQSACPLLRARYTLPHGVLHQVSTAHVYTCTCIHIVYLHMHVYIYMY